MRLQVKQTDRRFVVDGVEALINTCIQNVAATRLVASESDLESLL